MPSLDNWRQSITETQTILHVVNNNNNPNKTNTQTHREHKTPMPSVYACMPSVAWDSWLKIFC